MVSWRFLIQERDAVRKTAKRHKWGEGNLSDRNMMMMTSEQKKQKKTKRHASSQRRHTLIFFFRHLREGKSTVTALHAASAMAGDVQCKQVWNALPGPAARSRPTPGTYAFGQRRQAWQMGGWCLRVDSRRRTPATAGSSCRGAEYRSRRHHGRALAADCEG